MCFYILLQPLCSHTSMLLAGPSCFRVLVEMHRIHEDASAWTAEGRQALPFEWPDECLPHDGNVRVVFTGEWCGWECRNSHVFDDRLDTTASTSLPIMGMPTAVYGIEREGVGWRDG